MRKAEDAVKAIANQLPSEPSGSLTEMELWAQFNDAELRLLNARGRLSEVFKSPEYLAMKKSITLLGSLVAGVGISSVSHLTMFEAAGYHIPQAIDVFLTGLIIGAGTGPMHSFIGFLQEFRNATSGLSELARGSAIQRVMDAKLKDSQSVGAGAEAMSKGIGSTSSPSNNLNNLRQARQLLRY